MQCGKHFLFSKTVKYNFHFSPGFIESDMTKDLNKDALLPFIPLKRFGTPEEVAGLVTFLAMSPSVHSLFLTPQSFVLTTFCRGGT